MSDVDIGVDDFEDDLPETETEDTKVVVPADGQKPEAPVVEETDLDDGEELPAPKVSREATRVQILVNRAKAESERAANLDKELAVERARREMLERQMAPKEDPREEEERMAMLTPEERMSYSLTKAEKKFEHQVMLMRFESADKQDLADYKMKAAQDPRYGKYADKVEQRLQELRKTGQNVSRELLLRFEIGEAVLNSKAKTAAQVTKAKENVDRQKAAPVAAKGDQKSGAKPSDRDALRKRLETVSI